MASGSTTGRVAKFGCLSVRKELGTCELANELAKLMSAKHGHRVTRPDAVHAAIKAAVNQLKTEAKMHGRQVRGQEAGAA